MTSEADTESFGDHATPVLDRSTRGMVNVSKIWIPAIALGVIGVSIAYGATLDNRLDLNEDDPGWSCVDDGNRVCGPGNSEGKPAACYDDGGVIVAMWPCKPWTPDMGHRDARGITTYPNGDRLNDEGETP